MTIREIRQLGDPVLRERCAPVERLDGEVRALAEDLMETMYAAEGVGLAAPQVGVPLRLFAYDVREPGQPAGVLVNPRILETSGRDRDEEGCLSIPGLTARVERAASVVMEGLDPEGKTVRIEAGGLLARCLLHENDHLDGILFLDRLSPLKRKLLLDRWAKERERTGSSRAEAGRPAL